MTDDCRWGPLEVVGEHAGERLCIPHGQWSGNHPTAPNTPNVVEQAAQVWPDKALADGWHDIDRAALYGAAVEAMAWSLLEQTSDTADRQPSVAEYNAATSAAASLLATTQGAGEGETRVEGAGRPAGGGR